MATIDFLTPAYLETIVREADKKATYDMTVLKTFFKNSKYAENGFVKVPKEVFNYEDILPLINRGAGIEATGLDTSRQYTTYEIKLFGDMKILKPTDIKALVNQLQSLTGDTYKSKKVELAKSIVEEFNTKVNATREYMACSALLGSIKDKDGNVIETFDIPTANKLGTKTVSDGTVKTYQLMSMMKKQMKKSTKYRGAVALVLGEGAYETIQGTEEYQTWAALNVNNVSVEDNDSEISGYFGNKKFPFIVLDEFYYTGGSQVQFFSTNSIIMCPVGVFAEFYTSIETNKGSFAKLKHIDEYEVWNPDGTAYRLQCSAMPIVTLPNAIITADLD